MSLGDAIRAAMKDRARQVDAGAAAGVDQATISRYIRGESIPNLDVVKAIEETSGRPLGWIAIQAGYVADVKTVAEAIAVDPDLDDGERQILMDVYLGFTNPQT